MSNERHSPTVGGRSLLEARHLDLWYQRHLPGEIHALRSISLSIHASDRVGLMGGSGSGKSTLFRVLARLQEPQAGKILATDGDEVLPSLVFQFPERQLFAESVGAEVGYGLRQGGLTAEAVEERVRQALQDVGLPVEDFIQRSPFHLSGGEMRRVAIAGVLAQRRRLVLFDEPTLGLDVEGTSRLAAILNALHQREVAYWIASHDADFVAATCSRLVVLHEGRVEFEGPSEELWGDPGRAANLGVRIPRDRLLAARVRDLRSTPGPDDSGMQALAAALQSLTVRP